MMCLSNYELHYTRLCCAGSPVKCPCNIVGILPCKPYLRPEAPPTNVVRAATDGPGIARAGLHDTSDQEYSQGTG